MATYDYGGVKFNYPDDWELSEDEDDAGQASIHVQSPATAFWSLNLAAGRNEPAPLFEAIAEALESEHGPVDRISPEITDPLGGQPAAAETFEFVVHELPAVAEARVATFTNTTGPDRTALVLWQYADAESDEVEVLLERMTASLTVGVA